MTKKESLIAQAQEAGLQLTGKENIAELEERFRTGEVPAASPVDNDHIEKGSDQFKAEFTVLNSSGAEVRTYSVEIHGPDAGKLAEQFASKIGGSVA